MAPFPPVGPGTQEPSPVGTDNIEDEPHSHSPWSQSLGLSERPVSALTPGHGDLARWEWDRGTSTKGLESWVWAHRVRDWPHLM